MHYERIHQRIENFQMYVSSFEKRLKEQFDHVKDAERQIDDFVARVTALAEQKKREINKRVRDQKNEDKLKEVCANLTMVRAQEESFKDLIEEYPTLALKSIKEYDGRLNHTLRHPKGTFMKFEARFLDTKNMFEIIENTEQTTEQISRKVRSKL